MGRAPTGSSGWSGIRGANRRSFVDEVDQLAQDARIAARQDAVAEVEHVPGPPRGFHEHAPGPGFGRPPAGEHSTAVESALDAPARAESGPRLGPGLAGVDA